MYDPLNVYRGRYKEFIEDIMKERPLNEHFEYSEYHHVIPFCCEGIDNDEDNIRVYLTYREHFISHKILTEENPENRKLFNAYWRMCNGRVKISTPEEYEDARRRHAEFMRGEGNPVYNGHTEETRKKMSYTHTGSTHSLDTKKKISDALTKCVGESRPWYGRHHTEETKQKISEANVGKKRSEETKRRISNAKRGKSLSDSHKKKISESCRNPSEETRKKMSESHIGFSHTEETKQKMSESARLASKNRKYNLVCKNCGVDFQGRAWNTKYCDKCKGGLL